MPKETRCRAIVLILVSDTDFVIHPSSVNSGFQAGQRKATRSYASPRDPNPVPSGSRHGLRHPSQSSQQLFPSGVKKSYPIQSSSSSRISGEEYSRTLQIELGVDSTIQFMLARLPQLRKTNWNRVEKTPVPEYPISQNNGSEDYNQMPVMYGPEGQPINEEELDFLNGINQAAASWRSWSPNSVSFGSRHGLRHPSDSSR